MFIQFNKFFNNHLILFNSLKNKHVLSARSECSRVRTLPVFSASVKLKERLPVLSRDARECKAPASLFPLHTFFVKKIPLGHAALVRGR